MKTRKLLAVALGLLGILLSLQAPNLFAQDQDQDQNQVQNNQVQNNEDDGPPGRVARMNFTQGSVSFQPGGEGDWADAVPNRPLTQGDNLWADKDSRAELHIGSTALRMDAETSLTFLDLDDRTIQLRLSQGSLIVNVRHIDDGDTIEVDTPNLAFSLLHPGEYRIDVNGDGNETITTVFRGRGEVTGGGFSYTVIAGQSARFTGTDHLDYDIAQLPSADDFDRWATDRDRRDDSADSSNYISSEMTGYEDLDDNGQWRYEGGYGNVWIPRGVAADWAPYRYGHWVWVAPWGWTWVEDEPWGFAPFHYGRWAYIRSGWCWVPGPVVVRPVYAPALVAFVGGGGASFAFSIGGGPGIAWFPLGPGEVFVPGYRAGPRYVNRVNITNTVVNVTKVTNVYNYYNGNNRGGERITYINQRVQNGVTAVSRDTFINARPVARNLGQVDARRIADAPVERDVAVQPDRASRMGAGQPARVRPPERVIDRPVIARRMPSPEPGGARPVSNVREAAPGARDVTPNGKPAPKAPGQGRPQPNPAQDNRNQGRNVPRPDNNNRPPDQAKPQPQPSRNQADDRDQNSGRNNNQDNPPRRNVKPAPPVQERNPQQTQEDENKYRRWENQRPKPAPQPPRAEPQNRPEPPKREEPKREEPPKHDDSQHNKK